MIKSMKTPSVAYRRVTVIDPLHPLMIQSKIIHLRWGWPLMAGQWLLSREKKRKGIEPNLWPLAPSSLHTLIKIKLNEPVNSSFMGLHWKCFVKSVKNRWWGNYCRLDIPVYPCSIHAPSPCYTKLPFGWKKMVLSWMLQGVPELDTINLYKWCTQVIS